MTQKKPESQPGELFYLDKDGQRQDAELHAELLGDDECVWDLNGDDLAHIAVMNDAELDAFLAQRQAAGPYDWSGVVPHAGEDLREANARADHYAAENVAWVYRRREVNARRARAAGRYPRIVTAEDIARWRADPSTLDLPVVGSWLPRRFRFGPRTWTVEVSMDQPGQRTPEDLELFCTSVADFVEAITPGLAYGITIQVRPAWAAVQEFIPPVAKTRGSKLG